jgi:PAS domain-containing protein
LTLTGSVVRASEAFCSLLGYELQDLVGKKIDSLTANRTLDVPKHLGAIYHFGLFEGLWLFVCRDGNPIIVRFTGEVSPDLSIEMRFEIPEHPDGESAAAGSRR